MNRNTRISRNRNKNKNRRNRSLKQVSKNIKRNRRQRVSRNRRQRVSRNRRQRVSRNRQRGGFFTTAVTPIEGSSVTTSSIANEVSSGQDCNLRNNASIFQSTFDNIPNSVAPKLNNYLLVNDDLYVSQ